MIAWLWARTVKSPNPAFADIDVPLASTFILSKKKGKEAWVEPVIEEGVTIGLRCEQGYAAGGGARRERSLRGEPNFRCLMSETPC